jgi:uncharacterized protein
MGKYLLLLVLAAVAYLLWKGARGRAGTPPGDRASPRGERMVDCSQCGVHLPVSEAVAEAGRYFCCDEHRRLFQR